MKKSKVFKIISTLIIFIFIVGSLACYSYSYSKQTAEKIVGTSLQYFTLSESKITFEPFSKKYPVWMFKFSNPNVFDAEFEIYTTLFGKIEITNPKNLAQRLRNLEKSKDLITPLKTSNKTQSVKAGVPTETIEMRKYKEYRQ